MTQFLSLSLFRFHFDHYELSGQWLGQYTANRHGRPKTWTGSHEHLLDIATGLEMCLGCSWLGAILWAAITTVLILHRCEADREWCQRRK